MHDRQKSRADTPVTLAGTGVSQHIARAQNEWLILNLLRAQGETSAADLARMTGLSAQTISVILRSLEAEGMVLRGAPRRGRIGQPSIPIHLNPDGALFFGASIGRRSAELRIVDVLGQTRWSQRTTYAWPDAHAVTGWLRAAAASARAAHPGLENRLRAMGLAIPFRLWEWSAEVDAPAGALDAWRAIDLQQTLSGLAPVIHVMNDATAACAGELAFGAHQACRDVLYFYIGTFVGGGLARDGVVIEGPTGNAGAMASILVPAPGGQPVQLLDCASLIQIDHAVSAVTAAPKTRDDQTFWQDYAQIIDPWLDNAARALAFAIVSACAVTDSRDVIIDGLFPGAVHDRLMLGIAAHLANLDTAGLDLPTLHKGTLGAQARPIGAAAQVINAYFAAQIAPLRSD